MDEAYSPFPTNVDNLSFALGMVYAFSEAVASGCKRLALSPPIDPAWFAELHRRALPIAAEYSVVFFVEDDFPENGLFDVRFTLGKHILGIAANQAVADEYAAWRQRARNNAAAMQAGDTQASAVRQGLAREFGDMLGYAPDVVTRLLSEPRFA